MSWRQRLTQLAMAGGLVGAAAVTPSCMNCGQKLVCAGDRAIECRNVGLCADLNGDALDDGGCELPDGGVVGFDGDGGVLPQ